MLLLIFPGLLTLSYDDPGRASLGKGGLGPFGYEEALKVLSAG